MFMLRNVSKYLFGDTSKETIIEIPQGQLYLVRPRSPKGYSELIFRDAAASVRRTGSQFQYQLVVQRVFEEGEQELLEDEDDEDGAAGSINTEKDERTFLLDEGLCFCTESRQGGETVFAWKDLSGDDGDLYEFVCDAATQPSIVASFEVVAVQCQYERKYRKSAANATEEDLQQFSFSDQPIPSAVATPESRSPARSVTPPLDRFGSDMANIGSRRVVPGRTPIKAPASAKSSPASKSLASPKNSLTLTKGAATVAPPSAKHPEGTEVLANEIAELHLFDFESGTFILQDADVLATVSEVGTWQYWIQIAGQKRDWLGQAVVPDLNPVFNFEYLSFIFNHYSEDGAAYSWLLRFKDTATVERFQEGVMQALWEHLNKVKWTKMKDNEKDYMLEAFQDLALDDIPEGEDEEASDEEEDEEDEVTNDGQRSEHYDTDESDDDVDVKDKDGNVNSLLAVGYKHDRSFVVRGSKIGVFKHTPDNNLRFSTSISKVQTPNGKLFSPKKIMLHAEDTNLILQNGNDPNSLYRMDLEYGKVVDEWKIHDDIPVTTFAPEKKFSQMTGEQTFLGLSANALYRIDPRLAGTKLVDSELKQYASKTDFSAAATTSNGYIAVASNKGDIRMFDRLGIIAKTTLPALGDPIIGLDVSADGRWVLATTNNYLLLIDALQTEGKNAGKLGFERAFAKDAKPQPRRLALSPSHVAQFMHETRAPISFTQARFNTGPDEAETTIVTATGPFVVTWSMRKLLAGRKDPYSIKRYAEEVKADDFKFGTDKNLIVALPNQVEMVGKAGLKKPTRESIGGYVGGGGRAGMGSPGGGSGGGGFSTPIRRSARGASSLRNQVVDSPY